LEALPLNLLQVQDGLSTRRLAAKFHYFKELDSTNSYAWRLADKGAPEGEVVISEYQANGRGRLGRSWVSPPYLNLYFSVILRPNLAPTDAPQLTLMTAVALADTIGAFVPKPALIKWPNDILLEDKKVAGVLAESSCSSTRIEFVILGIGINVNFARESMPDSIRQRATSLLDAAGHAIGREDLLRRLIQDLDRCYGILEEDGFSPIAARWKSRFGLQGHRVRVNMIDQSFSGEAIGIDRDGALLVKTNDGTVARVIAGDVVPGED